MVTLMGYKKCSTCAGIEKLLKEKNIEYTYREIDKDNPTEQELKKWHKESQLPLKRFFNTSGILYREMKLAQKLPDMSQEEQYKLLASDGMLVKRPILFIDGKIYVGPDVKKYLEN